MFGVLQLAYFSLSEYDFFPLFLYPLRNFKTFNGLNINLFSDKVEIPLSLKQMNLSATFLNNCNIMIIVLFAELLIAVTLCIVSKFVALKKLRQISHRLLKQGFITLVLFNIYNISFSSGFHFKYALNFTDSSYWMSLVTIAICFVSVLVSTVAMLFVKDSDYGEFKLKFKKNCICRLYIPFTILYRMCLGFYISLENTNSEATLIVIAFSFIFIMYNVVNLPFSNVFQNYRSNFIHIVQFVILLTANFYR